MKTNRSILRPLALVSLLLACACQPPAARDRAYAPDLGPEPCWRAFDSSGHFRGAMPDPQAEKCIADGDAKIKARGNIFVLNAADGCSFWEETPAGVVVPGSRWGGCCPEPIRARCLEPESHGTNHTPLTAIMLSTVPVKR